MFKYFLQNDRSGFSYNGIYKEVDFLVTDMATFDREHAALVQARSETGITDCTIIT